MGKIRFGVIIPQGWLDDLPNANAHKQWQAGVWNRRRLV